MKLLKKTGALVMTFALALSMLVLPAGAQAAKKTALNKTKATLAVGDTLQLKLKNAPKGKAVKWKSNKKSVATVSKSGKVAAKKAGTAKITANVNKKSYTCTVKVDELPFKYKKVSENVKIFSGMYFEKDGSNFRLPSDLLEGEQFEFVGSGDYNYILFNAKTNKYAAVLTVFGEGEGASQELVYTEFDTATEALKKVEGDIYTYCPNNDYMYVLAYKGSKLTYTFKLNELAKHCWATAPLSEDDIDNSQNTASAEIIEKIKDADGVVTGVKVKVTWDIKSFWDDDYVESIWVDAKKTSVSNKKLKDSHIFVFGNVVNKEYTIDIETAKGYSTYCDFKVNFIRRR